MRMWNLPAELICDQHLRGEHVEMHMFVGVINSKTSLKGYLEKGQLHVGGLLKRHGEVAEALTLRTGMPHLSPLPLFEPDPLTVEIDNIDLDFNMADLESRCWLCSERIRIWRETGSVPYLRDSICYKALGRKDDRRGTSKRTELKAIISHEVEVGFNIIYQNKLFTVTSVNSSVNGEIFSLKDNAGNFFSLFSSPPKLFLEVIQ